MATVGRARAEEREAKRTTVLVIDDEESFHRIVAKYLRGYRLVRAYNGWQGLTALAKHHIDAVLLDLNLPDTTGLRLLGQIRAEHPDVEVIIITAHSEIQNAVDAVKAGAFDFVAKSFENYQQLDQHVERAMQQRRWRREQADRNTRDQWLRDAFLSMQESQCDELRAVVSLAKQVADTPLTVLIEGESGVGKEVLAQYIRASSQRAAGPFVPVNLAAVPAALLESHLFGHVKGAFTGATETQVGKFELADTGTIFLDEIGDLSPTAQVKLLRVLQEREVERVGANESAPVDVRVIAATNKDLAAEVAAGRFREDLFFRLNVVRITVPPLRDRWRDIPELVRALSHKHAERMQRVVPNYAEDALDALSSYDWPGNIRELENLIMRLVAIHPGKLITADDIPPEYCLSSLNRLADDMVEHDAAGNKESRLYFLARDKFERYLVRLMINRCGGNKRAAAQALGVSYSTIKEKARDKGED